MDIKESDKTRIGNSLICSFAQIAQIKWAICSDRSGQMSNCEQIAQVANDKRANVSDSLRVLMINEQIRDSFKKTSDSLIRYFAHKKERLACKF